MSHFEYQKIKTLWADGDFTQAQNMIFGLFYDRRINILTMDTLLGWNQFYSGQPYWKRENNAG